MDFRSILLISALLSPVNAYAYSPQPEYISVESLFEAKLERGEVRSALNRYLANAQPVCNSPVSDLYQSQNAKKDADFNNYIASLSDTQLLVDLDIVAYDFAKQLQSRRATVRCSIQKATDQQSSAYLKRSQERLEILQEAVNAALAKLESNEDK